jgi:hypothetical protein
VALSSLHHIIDLEWMKEAYRLTRKDGAPGIDGVTAADYATNLEGNLLDLLLSARSALQSLHTAIMSQGLRWVVDIDIVKYFDSIPHSNLRAPASASDVMLRSQPSFLGLRKETGLLE